MRKIVYGLILLGLILLVNCCKAAEQPLTDINGKQVSLSVYKGKIVVLDFWFTGCINCMNFYKNSLLNAERHFEHNKDVVFVSICVDKDKNKWLNSLKKGKYASKSSLNLYTDGSGDQDEIVKQYNILSYPQPIVLGRKGTVLSRADSLEVGDKLIKTIERALH